MQRFEAVIFSWQFRQTGRLVERAKKNKAGILDVKYFRCCSPPRWSRCWSMSFAVDLAVRSAGAYQMSGRSQQKAIAPRPLRLPPASDPDFSPLRALIAWRESTKSLRVIRGQPRARSTRDLGMPECLMLAQLEYVRIR